ncbi:MAG: methylmalonyl-CoA epimerase [Chloroflexi bacterium]|nr:methylmalonyl-CoA epimerase [Chloroflexota bacterium]
MIKRLDHVAIAVKSMGPVLETYRRLLGFSDVHIEDVPQQGVKAAMLPVPGAEIELLEPIDPQGAVARFLERRGEGLHHICLEVDDIADELARLKATNVPLVDQQARPGLAGNVAFLHPRASHGTLVELAQKTGREPKPGKPPPGITGLGHAAVVVKDMAQAFRTFATILGVPVDGKALERPAVKLGFIKLGNSDLELLEPVDPNGDQARFLAERGEGLYHFCLYVADLPQKVAALQKAGVKLDRVRPPERPDMAFIHQDELHGVPVELMQAGWHPR